SRGGAGQLGARPRVRRTRPAGACRTSAGARGGDPVAASRLSKPMPNDIPDLVFATIEARRDELVDLARQLIRFPTVNPPGEAYRPCAEFVGRRLPARGFTV